MKLTPLDIRHREFRRGIRGYADEEVDVFLDEVADELDHLSQENAAARDRLERLEEQLSQYETIKETLQKTLVTAQQQADDLKESARKETELILRDAELKAREIVGESYLEKQRVQQSLIQLKQVEEGFRFKFRSLLEAHLNLVTEDDASEDRRAFRGLVEDVERELGEDAAAAEPAASGVVAPEEEGGPPRSSVPAEIAAAMSLAGVPQRNGQPPAGETPAGGEGDAVDEGFAVLGLDDDEPAEVPVPSPALPGRGLFTDPEREKKADAFFDERSDRDFEW